jgi:hypothetical protein
MLQADANHDSHHSSPLPQCCLRDPERRGALQEDAVVVWESEGGEVASPWTSAAAAGAGDVATMLGNAWVLKEIFGRTIATLGTFMGLR